jgi:hypothetical protein
MLFARNLTRYALWTSVLCSLAVSQADAQVSALTFTYASFSVPGAVSLGVESINGAGTVSGYYSDASGNTRGFLLPSGGMLATLIDPGDTNTPGYTQANQITQNGTVFGEFNDAANFVYSGFIYKNGSYTTYTVPGQPSGTTTGLYGGNDSGGVCGFVFPPPYTVSSAFVGRSNNPSLYQINGAQISECIAMNSLGSTVGIYVDSVGTYHTWVMNPFGKISFIDVPGAAITPGAAPCLSGPVAGTVGLGINDLGEVSGHFWDSSYNEHGFLLTATGKFYQLDVPGAYQTAGGGLNNRGNIVGHYVLNVPPPSNHPALDVSSCSLFGFIATTK